MKKVNYFLFLLPLCFLIIFQQSVISQEKLKVEKVYKNTIRYNITHPLIFGGKAIIFGYERVLPKNRSFSINIGQAVFPNFPFVDSDSVKHKTIFGEKGFNFSADYRFYLSKENKFAAPRGVYIGPYYSYNYFNKQHTWAFKGTTYNGDINTDLSINIHTIGAELGYQFVLWNRCSIDMILAGPGVGFYSINAKLSTTLPDGDKEKFFAKLNEALAAKFPGYSQVINEGSFRKTGSTNTSGLGFRYMIQVGFRF